MEVDEVKITLMDLKYCERCGALFLRPRETEEAYCPSCELEVAELPSIPLKPNRSYLRRGHKIKSESEGETLLAYSEGGHA